MDTDLARRPLCQGLVVSVKRDQRSVPIPRLPIRDGKRQVDRAVQARLESYQIRVRPSVQHRASTRWSRREGLHIGTAAQSRVSSLLQADRRGPNSGGFCISGFQQDPATVRLHVGVRLADRHTTVLPQWDLCRLHGRFVRGALGSQRPHSPCVDSPSSCRLIGEHNFQS